MLRFLLFLVVGTKTISPNGGELNGDEFDGIRIRQ